jgi:signal transduction histidine kinase
LNAYLILLLSPALLVELYLGGRIGNSLAAMSCFFLGFLMWQGKILNRTYRTRTARSRLISQRRKELEERVAERTSELNRAKDLAESANRAKSEFLANMSHEIRTPMHGVLGLTELAIDNSDNPPETAACLEGIQMSANSLLNVINDILDFSRIEARKLVIEKHPFFLRDCIDQCLQVLRSKAQEKSLPIRVCMHPPLSHMIIGDSLRLQQIITNLLHNAVKFTNSGSITLSAYCEAIDNHTGVHIAVADTGCGIPKDKRQQIFEAFSQADGSTTRKFGGTGLGLTISCQLTQLMGGRIWMEGNSSGGSTFHITLPMEMAATHIERLAATQG